MCLVSLKDFVAKGLALGVENDRYIFMITGLHERSDHVDDTFHRTGGLPSAGYQRWQSMEGPVQIGGAIHKYEFFRLRYCQKPVTPIFT